MKYKKKPAPGAGTPDGNGQETNMTNAISKCHDTTTKHMRSIAEKAQMNELPLEGDLTERGDVYASQKTSKELLV